MRAHQPVVVLLHPAVDHAKLAEGAEGSEGGGASGVSGYCIQTLDFEGGGLGGWVKALGARKTQKIPAFTGDFHLSLGNGRLIHRVP